MKKTLMTVLAILFLAGCKSNPYPDGDFSSTKIPHHDVQVQPSLIVPSKVNFTEGIEGSFTINATVPPPGQPVITVDGLPKGAIFSPIDNRVTWQPDYDAGNDPNDPTITYRTYTILVMLQSTVNAKIVLWQEEVTLIVNDSPRPFHLLNFEPKPYLNEGDSYEDNVTIEDIDSPAGPFNISLTNPIPGTAIVPDLNDPTKFKISIVPGYDLVKWDPNSNSNTRDQKSFNWSITIVDSKGRVVNVPVSWQVNDKRQKPEYIGPEELSVKSPSVDFVFIARDPNFEIEPQVSHDSVDMGDLNVDPIKTTQSNPSNGIPTGTYHVRWSNLPESVGGTIHTLTFSICVRSIWSGTLDNCRSQDVVIKFDFVPAPASTPLPTPAVTIQHRGNNL